MNEFPYAFSKKKNSSKTETFLYAQNQPGGFSPKNPPDTFLLTSNGPVPKEGTFQNEFAYAFFKKRKYTEGEGDYSLYEPTCKPRCGIPQGSEPVIRAENYTISPSIPSERGRFPSPGVGYTRDGWGRAPDMNENDLASQYAVYDFTCSKRSAPSGEYKGVL